MDAMADQETSQHAQNAKRQLVVMMFQIAIVIYTIELLIMIVLSYFDFSASPLLENTIDATTLTVTSTPIIYFMIVRPFVREARYANAMLSKELDSSRRLLMQNERLTNSLQKANASVAEINEMVLQRIGADLHDGPAQMLTYSLLQHNRLEALNELIESKEIGVDLDKLRRVIADTLQEIRAISTGLVLPELTQASLDEVISLAVRAHQELGGCPVTVRTENLPATTSLPVKICTYRVVQEALSNTRKHSRATSCEIFVAGTARLTVKVTDNGCGIDPERADRNGLGLTGMRARVGALGGALQISSAPTEGTSVQATLDLNMAERL
jgi:signal transduction histidine kinase